MNHTADTGQARVVVVTPTLGRSRYLDLTVESVRSQTVQIRHILAAPPSVAEGLRNRYPSLEIVAERSKGGLYAAINDALEAAGPWEWCSYINDDDMLAAGFSSMVAKHAMACDGIAYGDVRFIDEAGRSLGRVPNARDPRHLSALFRLGMQPLTQQGTLIPADVYALLGGFSPTYRLCADQDFWLRALANGVRFKRYPVDVASYRISQGQLSGDQSAMQRELTSINTMLDRTRPSRLGDIYIASRFRVMNWRRYAERFKAVGLSRSSHMFSTSVTRHQD